MPSARGCNANPSRTATSLPCPTRKYHQLLARDSYNRLASEFAILTAARSGEVRGALWKEIDFDQKLWTIAKDRMKDNREHVVPFCMCAIRIIERCAKLRVRNCPVIFSGMRGEKLMSDMTLTKLLKTLHGSWVPIGADWVSEEADHRSDVQRQRWRTWSRTRLMQPIDVASS